MTAFGWPNMTNDPSGLHLFQAVLDAVYADAKPGSQLSARDRRLGFQQREDFFLVEFLIELVTSF